MPKVPESTAYTPYPTQTPENIPSPEFRVANVPDAFGVNIGQAISTFGGDVKHAGDELFNRAIAIQDLQNETDAANKNVDFMAKAGELHAAFNAKEGNERVQAAPKYFQDLQDLRNNIRSTLPSPNSQRMFDHQSLSTLGHTIFNGAGAAGEAQKKYSDDTTMAEIQANLRTVEGMPEDDVLAATKEARNHELIAKYGESKGWLPGDANERLLIAKTDSEALTRRIKKIAYNGEPLKAEQMLLNNSSRILDDDQTKLQALLRSEVRSVETANVADAVYNEGKGTPTKPQMSLKDMETEVAERTRKVTNDPVAVQHAVQNIRSRFNQDKYAGKVEENENNQVVAAAIMKLQPRDERDLRVRGGEKVQAALDALPETTRLGIASRINRFNDAFNKRDNEDEDTRLTGLKNNNVEEYLNTDMTAQGLSHGQMIKHMNAQAQLMKNPTADPRVTKALSDIRVGMGAQLEALGIYRRTEANKDQYDHYAGGVQAGIVEWMDAHQHKPPTSKQVLEEIAPQVIRQRVDTGGFFGSFFGGTKRPFYDQDVPEDFKTKVNADLMDKQGREAEPEELYKAYQRKLFQELYGKKEEQRVMANPEEEELPFDDPSTFGDNPADFIMKERRAATSNAVMSLDEDPDKAARALQVSRSTGVPAPVVYNDQEHYEEQHKAAITSSLLNNSKYLSRYVNSNPMASKISADDWGTLDEVSDKLDKGGFQALPYPQNVASIASVASKAFWEKFTEEGVDSWMYQTPGSLEWVQQHPFFASVAATVGTVPTVLSKVFGAGLEGINKGIIEAYQQAGGTEQKAQQFARDLTGMAEYEMMGVRGHPMEVPHDLVDKIQAHRLMDYIARGEEPPMGISPMYDLLKVEEAKFEMKKFDEMMKAAQASNTRERDPDTFADFARNQTGEATIGVDPHAVRQLYGDKVPTADDGMLGYVHDLATQLEIGERTGADIQIPLADWMAHTDPEIAKQLHDFTRVKPNIMTLEESKVVKENNDLPQPMGSGDTAVDAVRAQSSLEPMFDPERGQKISLERTDKPLEEAQPLDEESQHHFILNDAEGKQVGNMSINEVDNGKGLYINWLGAKEGVGALGPRAIRDLLSQIKREFPKAEELAGFRAVSDTEGTTVAISIKDMASITDGEINVFKQSLAPDAIGEVVNYGSGTSALIVPREMYSEKQRALVRAVDETVERLMPKNIGVQEVHNIARDIDGGRKYSAATYLQFSDKEPLIIWALTSRDPVGTMRHEAIHHLKAWQFLHPAEWDVLEKAAKDMKWLEAYDIKSRYGHLSEEAQLEEAVAEGFRHWGEGELKPTGAIDKVFQKIDQLLTAVMDTIRTVFYRTPTYEQLFREIDSGKIGRKEGMAPVIEMPLEKPKESIDKPELPSDDQMRDAGLTDYEIRREKRDPDPTKMRQIKEGYTYVQGSWKKVTPEVIEDWRANLTAAEAKLKTNKEKLEAAFAKEEHPQVSHILGSDWQSGYGNIEDNAKYRQAAFNAVERDVQHVQAQLEKYERVLANTKEPSKPIDRRFMMEEEPPTTKMKQQELPQAATTRMEERSPFAHAAAVGMTKDQYRRYQALIDKRNAEDAAKQMERVKDQERIRQSKEWKDNAAEMRKETEQEVLQRPDIQADNFLRKGELYGERVPGKLPKIDSSKLTPEQRKAIPKEYQSSEGMSPDDIGSMFGYQSGDALIGRLSQLQQLKAEAGLKGKPFLDKIIDDTNDRKMEQKYGNLQENIIQEAKDQVLSKTQLDIIHEDVLALASKNQRAEISLSREVMEEQMIKQFNATSIGMLKSADFLRSAGKAGKAAEISLLKSDPSEAFRQKQVQFNAMVAAKMAIKLEKQVKSFDKLADTYSKRGKPGDLVSGTAQEYTNFIHEILLRIEKPVKRSIQDLADEIKREGYSDIKDFMTTKYGNTWGMNNIPISELLFDQSWRKPYNSLTVDEFREISNSVKALSVAGKGERTVTVAGEKVDRQALLDKMVERVETFPLKFDKGQVTATPTLAKKVTDLPRAFLASSTSLETLFNRFDRDDPYGVFNKYVVYPLASAANYKNVLTREMAKAYQALGKLEGMDRLVDSPFIDPQSISKENPEGSPMKNFTMANVMVMIHNAGNEHNWNVLAKGYGMEPAVLKQWLFTHSTKEMWDRAQKMGDTLFKPTFEKAQTVYHNIYGVAPEKIDLMPFDTPFGRYEGWYHPLIKDPLRESYIDAEGNKVSGQSVKQKGGTIYDSADNFHARTTNGYTKTRTGAVYPLDLNADMIPIRLSQMLHDIAFRDAIIQAEKIFRDDGLRNAITKHYGKHYTDGLSDYLRGVAGEEGIPSVALAQAKQVSEYLRQNVISAYIGFNPFTALKHGPTALIMSARQVGPINFLNAMKDLYRRSEDINLSNKEFVDKWSEEVGRRTRHWQDTISGQHADIEGKGTWRERIIEAGSWLVAQSDMASVRPTWLAAYREAIAKDPDNHGLAVSIADRAVRFAHGSTAITNQPALVRGGGPLHSWLTSIYGFFGTVMQRRIELAHVLNDTYQLGREGEMKQAAGKVPDILGRVLSHVIWPIVVEEYVTGLTTEDKRGWGSHLLTGAFHGLGSSVLYLRDLMHSWTTGHDPGVGLISSPLHDVTNLVNQMKKGKKALSKQEAGKTVQDFLTVFGEATGRAPKIFGSAARFGVDMMNKQQHAKTGGDWFRGLTRGVAKPRVVK